VQCRMDASTTVHIGGSVEGRMALWCIQDTMLPTSPRVQSGPDHTTQPRLLANLAYHRSSSKSQRLTASSKLCCCRTGLFVPPASLLQSDRSEFPSEMEFPFSLGQLCSASGPGSELDQQLTGPRGEQYLIQAWSWRRVESLTGARARPMPVQDTPFGQCIDAMGRASAAAQKLKAVITSSLKFAHSHDVIYLHFTPSENRCNALLRTGRKRLFIRDESARIEEIEPQCVLDFYVHESRQRTGIGKQVFEFMLQTEKSLPSQYGYDRPSTKLLAFLAKHYDLKNYIPQNNNYVVFRKYFSNAGNGGPAASSGIPTLNTTLEKHFGRRAAPQQARPMTREDTDYSPRLQPAAGVRHMPHPSSVVVAGPSVAQLRGDRPSPRDRDRGEDRERDRGDYSSYVQPSPPVGQAAFAYQYGMNNHINTQSVNDQPDQATQEQLRPPSHATTPRRSSRHNYGMASDNSPFGGYQHPTLRPSQQQQQQFSQQSSQVAPASANQGSASNLHNHARVGSTAASLSQQQNPDEFRRTPPEGASRLAKAGSNVLGPFASGGGQGRQPSANPQRMSGQYNIHRGYEQQQQQQDQQNLPPQTREGRPLHQATDHFPPPQPPTSASELYQSNQARVRHGGVAPRPLADPLGAGGMRVVDSAIAQREAELRQKEILLAQGGGRYSIPYRQPNERDAAWSKAASYQRAFASDGPGAGGGGISGSVATGVSESNSSFQNPTRSTMVGGGGYGGYAGAGVGSAPQQQQDFYSSLPSRAPFAYGPRRDR
jgi:GNAT superfamily N-acetyltransferase